MIKEKNEEFIIYDFDNFKWYLESGKDTVEINESIRKIKTAIDTRLSAEGMFPVCINAQCQVNHIYNNLDIYFVTYDSVDIPTSTIIKVLNASDQFVLRNVEYGGDINLGDINQIIENIFEMTSSTDRFGIGLDHNPVLKYRVIHPHKEHKLLSFECNKLTSKRFNELIGTDAYVFERYDVNFDTEVETKGQFEFVDENERDVFGAALLDGCNPHEAYLVTKGLKFDEENKFDETISGYYKLRKEYRDYFKEEFRIGV